MTWLQGKTYNFRDSLSVLLLQATRNLYRSIKIKMKCLCCVLLWVRLLNAGLCVLSFSIAPSTARPYCLDAKQLLGAQYETQGTESRWLAGQSDSFHKKLNVHFKRLITHFYISSFADGFCLSNYCLHFDPRSGQILFDTALPHQPSHSLSLLARSRH